MEIDFCKIHKTVLEAWEFQNDREKLLEVIGRWYCNFLLSQQDKLSLSIPDYHEDYLNIICNYLRLFSLTITLVNKPVVTDFENTCLFNIFEYNKRKKDFNFINPTIGFVKKDADLLIWENGTVTKENRFLPLFKKNQIEYYQWNDIYNSFSLFKAMNNQGLINHPILIDLEKDLCLSIFTGDKISVNEYILLKTFKYDSQMNEESVIEYEDELNKQDVTTVISIKYPYHRNIHGYLLDIGKKKFNLIFNSRFYYYTLQDNDILLLPRELESINSNPITSIAKIDVFNTNHSIELFFLLDEFYNNWKALEFNKFTTPFPKYWFLFINPSIAKEEWFEMFKSSYPNAAEKPLINEIKKIIYSIYELDWGRQLIEKIEVPILLLPDINGLRKKKLEKPLVSFKNHLKKLNKNILFLENNDKYEYPDYLEVLMLDAFNVINIVNVFQKNGNIKILVPDFLYFSCHPWVKYHVWEYQCGPLLSPIREHLDPNFLSNKDTFKKLKEDLVDGIKLEIRTYRKKYTEVEKSVQFESKDIELIFNIEEEIELVIPPVKEEISKKYLILTMADLDFELRGTDKVLIRKNNIISHYASDLIVGDHFVLQSELNSSIYKDVLVEKLSKIPETVIDFQAQLSNHPNAYETLKRMGVVYKDDKYFNDKYVIQAEAFEADKFILPRKKEYWKVICEFLAINSNDMSQAWILHYGRKHINEIKNAYKHIYDLCLKSNYISEIENPELVNSVSDYIDINRIIFETEEVFNPSDIAKSILGALLHEIKFHEVKEIKTI